MAFMYIYNSYKGQVAIQNLVSYNPKAVAPYKKMHTLSGLVTHLTTSTTSQIILSMAALLKHHMPQCHC